MKEKTWQDRFDEFIEKTRDQDYDFRYGVLPHRIEAIKEFLNTEIQLALSKQREEDKKFILNILDGIDIADKEMGVTGGTKAIRLAIQNRI